MQLRKPAGRAAALFLILAALFVSGCSRVSRDTAVNAYATAQTKEAKGDFKGALTDYQTASRGDFDQLPQALVDLARVATHEKRYDVAVQAYTSLTQQHADAKVNAADPTLPKDMRVVRDWVGTFTDHKEDGPFYQVEYQQDLANHSKPAYKVMDGLVKALGNNPAYSYALALLIITAVVKLLMTPLTKMQFQTTRRMTAVQPKMKALQEQYKDKPEELNKRIMGLYKEEGVNPFGCGATMIIQFPILIGLYSVIRLYNFQFRHAHFLWVNPVTHQLAPDIIGKSLAQPDMALLLLYTVSMFISQKLTMMPAQDDQQRQQQMMMTYMMPIMFLFILKSFPSAFILYWLMFNVFTTWQQWGLMKAHPLPPPGAPQPSTAPSAPPPRAPEEAPNRGPGRTAPKRKRK
ncbi:MAG TPA: membrane protein insertase YidC [Armatimonadota bacterium]|jgi:YidC/Oxa1 family membrane protein insertase